VEAASAAGEACGDVQYPVAKFLRLGGGQFAVQEEDTGPGEEVDRGEAEFEPGGVDVEVAGGEAAEAGGLAASDVVLDGGMSAVADLQELGGTATGVWGVGEERLMPQAFVLVEQGELGSGCGRSRRTMMRVPAG
jgi:hypothetical protein